MYCGWPWLRPQTQLYSGLSFIIYYNVQLKFKETFKSLFGSTTKLISKEGNSDEANSAVWISEKGRRLKPETIESLYKDDKWVPHNLQYKL